MEIIVIIEETLLTQELVKEYFRYDENTGDLFKIKKTANGERLGIPLRGSNSSGYYTLSFLNKFYPVHRLIFIYYYGYLPKQVDHIDGNIRNNKIENLRACTNQQNQFNRKVYDSSKTGIKGVNFSLAKSKYVARIRVSGKDIHLGYFNSLENARTVREKAEIKYFGEFRRGGLDGTQPIVQDSPANET